MMIKNYQVPINISQHLERWHHQVLVSIQNNQNCNSLLMTTEGHFQKTSWQILIKLSTPLGDPATNHSPWHFLRWVESLYPHKSLHPDAYLADNCKKRSHDALQQINGQANFSTYRQYIIQYQKEMGYQAMKTGIKLKKNC